PVDLERGLRVGLAPVAGERRQGERPGLVVPPRRERDVGALAERVPVGVGAVLEVRVRVGGGRVLADLRLRAGERDLVARDRDVGRVVDDDRRLGRVERAAADPPRGVGVVAADLGRAADARRAVRGERGEEGDLRARGREQETRAARRERGRLDRPGRVAEPRRADGREQV
ncbi:MAG: hypothetical protein AVDCRST_MAG40-1100, partial [uncultured Gemmatimonadaceae bacterium]